MSSDNTLGSTAGAVFRLTVDERSLEAMIALGRYDFANRDITAKHFPMTVDQNGEWEAKYFHFDIDIGSDEAKTRVEAADSTNPWQAAQIGHLLAHGAKHPDEQRKFPIIALGSVTRVHGVRRVPSLDSDGAHRDLYLYWWRHRWDRDCRFLAVRKISVAPGLGRRRGGVPLGLSGH